MKMSTTDAPVQSLDCGRSSLNIVSEGFFIRKSDAVMWNTLLLATSLVGPRPVCRPWRCLPPRGCDVGDDCVTITLGTPLGIVFEELDAGEPGLLVSELREGGSAERSGQVWPRDQLLHIDGCEVRNESFDSIMEVLRSAEQVTLSFARSARSGRVSFPNGRTAVGIAGDPLEALALQCGQDVRYSCRGGTCGSCEMLLRDATGAVRPIRMCNAKLRTGESEVLMPEQEVVESSSLQGRLIGELAAEQPKKGWRPFG